MKSPIRGPCFENPQHTDCTGVCRPFCRGLTMVLGSTPADRSQAEETGFSVSSFIHEVCFGIWSQEISKRSGRDEISNPGWSMF
ncbi:unnamed protein product [Staurois parvus]|uniref:Uncharacterized protein n=1 Tax=Staurois parvus TaxID=386267 RepID=A0ABN9BQ10_9NEOB|nr:unnamed protein product [Staurois parvus]